MGTGRQDDEIELANGQSQRGGAFKVKGAAGIQSGPLIIRPTPKSSSRFANLEKTAQKSRGNLRRVSDNI